MVAFYTSQTSRCNDLKNFHDKLLLTDCLLHCYNDTWANSDYSMRPLDENFKCDVFEGKWWA